MHSQKKVIWSTPEKFNKSQRSQSKKSLSLTIPSNASTWFHISKPKTSASSWWRVIHLDQKTIQWTIPLMYWCWQLSHEIVIVDLWASSAAKTMCYQCVLRGAVCKKKKKTETNTSKSCRCVYLKSVHAHTFTHTSTALFYTFEIQCVILHIDAHFTHPQTCVSVCVCKVTHTHRHSFHPTFVLRLGCGVIGHSYAIV